MTLHRRAGRVIAWYLAAYATGRLPLPTATPIPVIPGRRP